MTHHIINKTVLPVGPNTYEHNKKNNYGFYVKDTHDDIDSFKFTNTFSRNLNEKIPNSTEYVSISADEIEDLSNCFYIQISIRPGKAIDFAINLLKDMAAELFCFSKAGIEDWFPGDDVTLQLMNPQETINQEKENITQKMSEEDEGFSELEDMDKAVESKKTRVIEGLQGIKDKVGKLDEDGTLSRQDLQKLKEEYNECFIDKHEVTLNKGVLTIFNHKGAAEQAKFHTAMGAVKMARQVYQIPKRVPLIRSVEAKFIKQLMTTENPEVLMAEIIGIFYQLYVFGKSLYEIYKAWNVLTKENKIFKDIISRECPEIRKGLEDVDEILGVLCRALDCSSPEWEGVISSIKYLIQRLSTVGAKVKSVTISLVKITEKLKEEKKNMKSMGMMSLMSTAYAAFTLTTSCDLPGLQKTALALTASTSAAVCVLSFVAYNALHKVVSSQIKVETSMKELNNFLEKSILQSQKIQVLIECKNYGEDSEFINTFRQMRISLLGCTATLDEIEKYE